VSLHNQHGALLWLQYVECGLWLHYSPFHQLSQSICYFSYKSLISGRLTYYQRVVIFEFLVSCACPLCVTAFPYVMTACHLLKITDPVSEKTQNSQLNTRKNTVVFLVRYVPYHAFWTYNISTVKRNLSEPNINKPIPPEDYDLQYMHLVSTCLLLINSCLNPVALFCICLVFRRQCKRYLTCCCGKYSPSSDLEHTKRKKTETVTVAIIFFISTRPHISLKYSPCNLE